MDVKNIFTPYRAREMGHKSLFFPIVTHMEQTFFELGKDFLMLPTYPLPFHFWRKTYSPLKGKNGYKKQVLYS